MQSWPSTCMLSRHDHLPPIEIPIPAYMAPFENIRMSPRKWCAKVRRVAFALGPLLNNDAHSYGMPRAVGRQTRPAQWTLHAWHKCSYTTRGFLHCCLCWPNGVNVTACLSVLGGCSQKVVMQRIMPKQRTLVGRRSSVIGLLVVVLI
jgi:hypothetical protein